MSLSWFNPAVAGPFTCTGEIYQVQSGQLKIFDPIISAYTPVGPVQSAYNAAGYNVNDGYVYAMQGTNLIRVHSDGSINILFAMGFGSNAGDMDSAGHLWIKVVSGSTTTLRRINVATGTVVSTVTLLPNYSTSDLVIFPTRNIAVLSNASSIARVDLTTGATTIIPVTNFPSDGYGAMWSDSAGRLFIFANGSGKIYEIFNFLGANPNAVQIATGLPSSNNDGFSCPSQPFPNLAPVAQADNASTPFQTAVTGNVLNDNGNGIDRDPENGALTVTTVPVSPPTNGSVTISSNGNFTYTPNAGFFGNDSFTYRITDPSGLTATAVVTITVTKAVLSISKNSILYLPTATYKFFVPGNDVIYNITVTNTGNQATDANSVFVVDPVPTNIQFFNGNINQDGPNTYAGTDPVAWQNSGSGLTFTYATDIRYSNLSTQPTSLAQCTYIPVSGYDSNVRYLCINPKNSLANGGSATFYFRGRIP